MTFGTCLRTWLVVALALFAWGAHDARAQGEFDIGVWHGSPVAPDGSFAYCGMLAFFGDNTTPVSLTIGLDRFGGTVVAVSSDRFKLPQGQIKAGLAFDGEALLDVMGEVRSPTMMAFKFATAALLDRHVFARKLVLVFSDSALPFALPRFGEAIEALHGCLKDNIGVAAAEALPTEPPAVAAPAPFGADANPRLLTDIVGPMVVGFVGSVLLVLVAGLVSFAIARARMQTVYRRLWTAEYHPKPAARPALAFALLDPMVRAPQDVSAAA